MATQAIDLSGGLVPAPQAPTNIDLSAGLVPKTVGHIVAPLTEQDAASGEIANQQAAQSITHRYNPQTKAIEPVGPDAVPTGGTGVKAGIKRNSIDALAGVWHAMNQPATEEEKAAILEKVRAANAQGDKIPETFATNPTKSTLALHRLLDAPADELAKKARDERGVAKELIEHSHFWKGGNLYLSSLVDQGLSAVPLVGPMVNSIAERGEGALVPAIDKKGNDVAVGDVPEDRRDLSGAATDVAAGMALENAPAIVRGTGKVVGRTAEAVGDAASSTAKTVGNAADKAGELASKAKQRAVELKELTKRPETPSAQHGTPVNVESPLDGPTVGKQLGGKDLSDEALSTLQQHVGEKIPAGSTAKNRLVASVEPVVTKINELSSKMNKVVQDAPQLTTSVMQDSVFGEGPLHEEFDALKKNLPASERVKLSADADAVLEDADEALNTQDPAKLLEYRRQLGRKIDWDAIEKNPSTPAEVQNAARAKVYQQITKKIHADIPDTVPLDKELQPNLELRSHLTRKVGSRLIDDPIAATNEAESEFRKGKTTLENNSHNELVGKNWDTIKTAIKVAGGGAGGALIYELAKILGF